MKKKLITTLKDKNVYKTKYSFFINLPNFDKKKNNFFYFNKRWRESNKLLKDFDYLNKIYEKNLKKLSSKLNKYHSNNYPIRYWRIITGKWLYKIICCAYERYDSILDIGKNFKALKFEKYQYDYKDFIPYGIEDFNYIVGTHSWNEYVYSEIICKCNIKNIEKKSINKILDNSEFNETYKRLTDKKHNLKGKVYSTILNLFSNLNKKKDYLIFDSYLKKKDELDLNFRLNKNPIILKPPSFKNVLYITSQDKNFSSQRNYKFDKKFKNFEEFIEKFIIQNVPKTYLENFTKIKNFANKLNLPEKPKVIFTTRGINRSTLLDNYIASKVVNGSKLLIAQHGGNYGQHKGHWGSKHELKMSDKFLSWGNKKTKKIIPCGLIKNIRKIDYNKNNKMILFESRSRLLYSHEFKIDQGAINSKIYYNEMKTFLSSIKEKKIFKNFYIKTNAKDFGWNEKNVFSKFNKNVKLIDKKLTTIETIKSAKLVIYSFPSTGHLECISANIPMLMFYSNDLNLLEKDTKTFFKRFLKLGILHNDPKKMYKKLIKIYDDPSAWWYSKKVQKVVEEYKLRYCRNNSNLIDELGIIIKGG